MNKRQRKLNVKCKFSWFIMIKEYSLLANFVITAGKIIDIHGEFT